MPLIDTPPDQVAKVYAGALFDLCGGAAEGSSAEGALDELQTVLELARADGRFGEFLASRALAVAARDAALERMFEGRLSPVVLRFLRLLNRKGRLGHLPAIVEALDHTVQAAFGRVEVDVFTAEAMDEASAQRLRERISAKLGRGVVLHRSVDPGMIGGIKLKVGDQLIDDSLATRLRRLRDRLTGEGASRIRGRAGSVIEGV